MSQISPTPETEKPFARRAWPDFVALGIGLAVAYGLRWETRDLVWSLWLCSLSVGFATLFAGIAGMLRSEGRMAVMPRGALLGGSLFYVVFFSVHFGAFHAGHSVFLQQFFPLEGVPEDGFGEAFMNPLLLWAHAIRDLMPAYGVFLIPALISEREQLRDAFGSARGPRGVGGIMFRPYANVIRMHLLIFFFAFAEAISLDSFLVYAVVYTVYFFPWRYLKNLRRQTDGLDRD
ncbi:MAG: hypothetical protein KDI28_08270 [Pseudomonadales bacterium]|nr:hypothetical protein [Pseudomonadales bacterium]